jgi:hypothetical protein
LKGITPNSLLEESNHNKIVPGNVSGLFINAIINNDAPGFLKPGAFFFQLSGV